MQEIWKKLLETWKTNPAVRWMGIAVAAVILFGLVWFGREIAVFFLSVLAIIFRAKIPKPTPHDPPTQRAEDALQSGLNEAKASKDASVLEEKKRAKSEEAAISEAKREALQAAKRQSDEALRSDVLNWRPSSPSTSSEDTEPPPKKKESGQ